LDYDARGVRGDPRGWKSGTGLKAMNPRWPARAEGEKRFRSACNAERGVVVKPAPVAAFKVTQTQLLFQLLVIPLDNPTMFRHFD
jgi:hypothetical protein